MSSACETIISELPPLSRSETISLREDIERHVLWAASAGREGQRLTVAEMPFADLGIVLAGRNLNGIELWNCDLSGLELSGVDLSGGRLIETRLRGCDLSGATLVKTELSRSDLSACRLPHASLRRTVLDGVCLIGADLTGADLRGASLKGADLTRAILTGADLRDVMGLETAQLEQIDVGGPAPLSGEAAHLWIAKAAEIARQVL